MSSGGGAPSAAALALPRLIVDAGPVAAEEVPRVLRGANREREDAGSVWEGRGAVSRVVRGPRPQPQGDRAAPRGRLHPEKFAAMGSAVWIDRHEDRQAGPSAPVR